jgi:hypothetical protein
VLKPLAALGAGVTRVASSWYLVMGVWILTILLVLPLMLVVGRQLESALATQPMIDLNAEEIDADWWREYRAHAQGFAATFTPAIIGFAAPLDHLSAVFDGRTPGLALAALLATYAVAWALLWGGLLHRFAHPRAAGVSELWSACRRHFPAMLVVSAVAAATFVVLYLTVHRWLFGAVNDWLVSQASTEAGAFAARVALYVMFGALLASVGLCADYTRVSLVTTNGLSLRQAWRSSISFLRTHAAAVVALFILNVTLFVFALAAYGVIDQRFGGWRAVLLAQTFVATRLVLRLVNAAAQVELFRSAKQTGSGG